MSGKTAYFLELSAENLLFRGTTRRVYRHPSDSSLLVKVPSAAEEARRLANRPNWKKRFKPTGIANITNLREIAEMLRLNPNAAETVPHIYSFVALAPTNHGWGQIVKAEYGADGAYAPSLEQIALRPELYKKPLEEFITWARETSAVFIDLEPWNVVLANRAGRQELVMIDGIGEKNAVALRTYFPSLNRKKNAKQIEQFFHSLELVKQGKSPARRQA